MTLTRVSALAAAFITFAGCAAATAWLWRYTKVVVRQHAETRFDFRVSETTWALQQRMLAYEQVLQGGVGFFAASQSVDRHEWRAYIAALMIGRNYPDTAFILDLPLTGMFSHAS